MASVAGHPMRRDPARPPLARLPAKAAAAITSVFSSVNNLGSEI